MLLCLVWVLALGKADPFKKNKMPIEFHVQVLISRSTWFLLLTLELRKIHCIQHFAFRWEDDGNQPWREGAEKGTINKQATGANLVMQSRYQKQVDLHMWYFHAQSIVLSQLWAFSYTRHWPYIHLKHANRSPKPARDFLPPQHSRLEQTNLPGSILLLIPGISYWCRWEATWPELSLFQYKKALLSLL